MRSALASAYLSLGSNLGNRLQNIKDAIQKIEKSQKILIKEVSSLYETQPVGYENQSWFLNLVIKIETSLDPFALLKYLLAIEDQMGRKRGKKWGPRNIDLDILFYENQVLNSDQLIIPHPQMDKRRFVLVGLAQIAPQLLHPVLKKNVGELLEGCEDNSIVRVYSEKI